MSDRASWIAAVAASVGAAATIAYTVISLKLWGETRNQARATQQQLELTSRQMTLAEGAYRAASRPVFSVSIKLDFPEDMTMQSRHLRIAYTLLNCGTAPLLNLKTTISDAHRVFSQEIYWGHVLPKEEKTTSFLSDISREVAASWTDQINAHEGQLNFRIGVTSFTPMESDQPVAIFSDWISAEFGQNVRQLLSSFSRN